MLSLLLSLSAPAGAAEVFDGRAYYLGDLHAHTGFSGDGQAVDLGNCTTTCGAVAGAIDTAKANGLDFLAIADHLNGELTTDEAGFVAIQQMIFNAHDPAGGFVTIPAVELHFQLDGAGDLGHKNLYMFADNEALASVTIQDVRPTGVEIDVKSCEEIWAWADAWSAKFGSALLTPHHPATSSPMGTDWSCHDPDWQPAVEMYSIHGNSLYPTPEFDDPYGDPREGGAVHEALNPDGFGYRLGFFGSTDNHKTMPGSVCTTDVHLDSRVKYGGGLAVVVLDESETFDRLQIRQAIVDRSTYGTSGPLVPVSVTYRVDGELAGGLGDELQVCPGDEVAVEIQVPESAAPYVTSVWAVTPTAAHHMDGDGDAAWSIDLADPPPWVYARVHLDGAAWYGEGNCDDGGDSDEERIWLSPTWIDPAPEKDCLPDTGDTNESGPDSAPDTSPDSPADSEVDSEDDTPKPTDTATPPPYDEPTCSGGCGCGSAGGGLVLLALPLLLWRRR